MIISLYKLEKSSNQIAGISKCMLTFPPSPAKKDMHEKFHLYEKQGVKEYWIVGPGNNSVRVFHLQSAGKESGNYDEGTRIPSADWREENSIAESRILEGFKADIAELFKESRLSS